MNNRTPSVHKYKNLSQMIDEKNLTQSMKGYVNLLCEFLKKSLLSIKIDNQNQFLKKLALAG